MGYGRQADPRQHNKYTYKTDGWRPMCGKKLGTGLLRGRAASQRAPNPET